MSPARALLDAVIAFYEGPGRVGDAGAAALLERALPSLRSAQPGPLSPQTLPVAALLSPALERIDPPIARALSAAASSFQWRQNPNYTIETMGAEFLAGYGYVEFAGPKQALFHAPAIRCGLLVLGPGIHYPPHAHPAEEVYHPLTLGEWSRGEERWRTVPFGEGIHHAPMVTHATRAGASTLLALYCWSGDTGTEARLT